MEIIDNVPNGYAIDANGVRWPSYNRQVYGVDDLYWVLQRYDIEEARQMIQNGANIEARVRDETPLMYTASQGWVDKTYLLLNAGVNVSATTDFSRSTALHYAAGHNDSLDDDHPNKFAKVVQLLIEHGANTDTKDRFGQDALQQAAFKGNTSCVNMLLQNGARMNAMDNKGKTALDHANFFHTRGLSKWTDTVDALLSAGALPSPFGEDGEDEKKKKAAKERRQQDLRDHAENTVQRAADQRWRRQNPELVRKYWEESMAEGIKQWEERRFKG